jgi:hypothetical protein
MDPNTVIGPMISKGHMDKVNYYIELGKQEGAKVVFGGGTPVVADKFKNGFWVQPTVFADVDNKMRIAQEEIFGPVPCIIRFKTEEDAVRIANDTIYGLSSYLWTNNTGRAIRLAKAIESGHDLRQQPERARPASALRRLEGVRHRPRRQSLQLRRVLRSQEHRRVLRQPPHSALGRLIMGKLVLAAKITHVPSMYLSEQDGPHKGCRQAAIDGHKEIARRMRALNVDTIVVFDTHWLVNSGYHINCAPLGGHLHLQRTAALHQEHAVLV